MKFYILSVLSFGALFTAPENNFTEKTIASSLLESKEEPSEKDSYDPARAISSCSIQLGGLFSNQSEYQVIMPIPIADLTFSYRTKILVSKNGNIGNGHRLSIGCNPIVNTVSLFTETISTKKQKQNVVLKNTIAFSLGYENLTYFKATNNYSPYVAVGFIYHYFKTFHNEVNANMHIHVPGFSAALGAEFNRKTSHPYFLEGGVLISKVYDTDREIQNTFLYYPSIKCGFAF